MSLETSSNSLSYRRRRGSKAVLIAGALAVGACATSYSLPAPRTLVVRSGARIYAEEARLDEIDVWVREHLDNIALDPSFLMTYETTVEQTYPWEGLSIRGDTAEVLLYQAAPEALNFLYIYGHFHLMDKMNRLDEFLPEAVGAQGYELERTILARLSDAWLYGRAVFDTPPYGPLDELLFANEGGYLDAFILTARPEEFEQERATWLRENPGQEAVYTRWFLETFETEPPGPRRLD